MRSLRKMRFQPSPSLKESGCKSQGGLNEGPKPAWSGALRTWRATHHIDEEVLVRRQRAPYGPRGCPLRPARVQQAPCSLQPGGGACASPAVLHTIACAYAVQREPTPGGPGSGWRPGLKRLPYLCKSTYMCLASQGLLVALQGRACCYQPPAPAIYLLTAMSTTVRRRMIVVRAQNQSAHDAKKNINY
jgi:hypothetical protein